MEVNNDTNNSNTIKQITDVIWYLVIQLVYR